MTKENFIALLSAFVAIVLIATGIFVGEAQASERERIARIERVLSKTAERSGYTSLGVIDAYAVSKETGYVYNGPAVRAALFERIGLKSPENCWVFTFDTFDGAAFMKLVVYKGATKEPIFEQEVEKVYLYAVI